MGGRELGGAPSDYSLRRLDGPSTVNGVTFRRWRITVELIDEPDDVLRDRLIDLLNKEGVNYHHWAQWSVLALRYGIHIGSWRPGDSRVATAEEWDEMRVKAARLAGLKTTRKKKKPRKR